jgi:hypothetical protein
MWAAVGGGGPPQTRAVVDRSSCWRARAWEGARTAAERGLPAPHPPPSSPQVDAYLFGSVPLKTYLPDGDIDVALVQRAGPSLRETWAPALADSLERAAADPACPVVVRDVTVVHAEVKGEGVGCREGSHRAPPPTRRPCPLSFSPPGPPAQVPRGRLRR